MNKEKETPSKEEHVRSRLDFSTSIEDLISGIFSFLATLLNTIWLLTFQRKKVATLIIEKSTEKLTLPFTFLTLMALPGSIYFQAIALAFKAESLTYRAVATNIVKLSSTEFSITNLILTTLPVIVSVTAIGYFLGKLFGKNIVERKSVMHSTCYAFGYSMLLLSVAGLLPLVLRAVIPSEQKLNAVISVTNIPLPIWAKLSGLPFSIYGLISAGLIISAVTIQLKKPKRKVVFYFSFMFMGWLAVLLVAYSSGVFKYINPHALIGAEKRINETSVKNLSCIGRSIDVYDDGTISWSFILENKSDEQIYLEYEPVRMWLKNWRGKIEPLSVSSWEGAPNKIIKVPSKSKVWASVSGKVGKDFIEHVRRTTKTEGGSNDTIELKYLWFSALARPNTGCTARSYSFPDKEKPIPLVRD